MDVQNEILKTISMMVQKEIENQKNLDVPSLIKEIDGDNYKVQVDGGEYWVKDGVGLDLQVGTKVWLHKPNGNISQMFIMAKR